MCQQAASIAKAFKAQLYLLHVIEPPPTLQLAQGLGFAEFDHPMKDDAIAVVDVLGEALAIPKEQQCVMVGSIKLNVLEKAKELGCDLIILGHHSDTKIPAFLGSTAHAVVHHAHCDVLILRR
jgi:universal stress protein A